MILSTEHLLRTGDTLEQSLVFLKNTSPDDAILYSVYRNSAVKSFELSLEMAVKLLRKVLKLYGETTVYIDGLIVKDIFRQAHKHNIMDSDCVKRWLDYRDMIDDNNEEFSNNALNILPEYLTDLRLLVVKIQDIFDASQG
jgi:hypothetical protein